MVKSYTHLNLDERIAIQMQLSEGQSMRAIARSLQRSPSSICRELHRCGYQGKPQRACRAGRPNYSDAYGIHGYSCSKA